MTPESQTPAPPKKPWYKRPLTWIIVAALVVVGGIANLVSGDDEPEAQPTETSTPEAVSDEDEAEEPEPELEETEVEEEPPVDDEQRGADLEQAIRDAFGGQEFTEIFVADATLWAGWITDVRVEGSDAYITLQIAYEDPIRDELGERAASALPTLLPAEALEGISWIIVEDASGVVIDQSML